MRGFNAANTPGTLGAAHDLQPAGQQTHGTPCNVPASNPLAIAALTTVFLANIAGAVMGQVAPSQIKRTGPEGRGLALAAVIIGWVSTAFSIARLIWLFTAYFTAHKSLRNLGCCWAGRPVPQPATARASG